MIKSQNSRLDKHEYYLFTFFFFPTCGLFDVVSQEAAIFVVVDLFFVQFTVESQTTLMCVYRPLQG